MANVWSLHEHFSSRMGETHLPNTETFKDLIGSYLAVVLPAHPMASQKYQLNKSGYKERLSKFSSLLTNYLLQLGNDIEVAKRIEAHTMGRLYDITRMLYSDIEFAFQEDPASKDMREIVACYPFVLAIAIHRFAHELYAFGVAILPRSLSEFVHSHTAIDIHPGAKIGSPFFIDHGTGVVIGETVEIGNYVCIFHGVTLGAFSFQRDASGIVIKGKKRHPTIEDNVILYSGCVILGGSTVIGANSIIGSNVWVTETVPPDTVVQFDPDRKTFAKIRR